MKKYLLGLAAVVVALSLSAFTGEYKKTTNVKDTADLHWFALPIANNLYLESTNTVNERAANSDCKSPITTECERAYTDEELINPEDPSEGVDPAKISTVAARLYFQ